MNEHEQGRIRQAVRETYARIVRPRGKQAPATGGCCGAAAGQAAAPAPSACCGAAPARVEGTAQAPAGADLNLGSGDPLAVAGLRPGETVVDLGSGAGRDVFPAARQVGPEGLVIGVDMTPEMVQRARQLAQEEGFGNVSFRLGEIEHLPVADASADVVISNCVVNLAPDKAPVYREAFRVLKPGGRLAMSDMVALRPLPAAERADPARWVACISGAEPPEVLERLLREAGFAQVRIETGAPTAAGTPEAGPPRVVPATIRASKPGP
jgi:SAM-dependent methyltransferase